MEMERPSWKRQQEKHENPARQGHKEIIMAKKNSSVKNSKSDDNSADSARPIEKMDKADLQAKYMQFEMLGRELEQYEGQKQVVDMKAKELKALRDSIDQIVAGEGFAQLGEGVYIPSRFTDVDACLVDIGMKIFVRMPKAETKKYLDKKSKEFDEVLEKIDCRCQELRGEMQRQAMELQGF
jgi:prefoldin subunit 5